MPWDKNGERLYQKVGKDRFFPMQVACGIFFNLIDKKVEMDPPWCLL